MANVTKINKYTVKVTKAAGITATYFVAALSLGGAELTALRNVFEAKYALAIEGWPTEQKFADLISPAASIVAVDIVLGR